MTEKTRGTGRELTEFTLVGLVCFDLILVLQVALGSDASSAEALRQIPALLWFAAAVPFLVTGALLLLLRAVAGGVLGGTSLRIALAVAAPALMWVPVLLEIPGFGLVVLSPVAALIALPLASLRVSR